MTGREREEERTAAEREWLRVNDYLQRHRHELAARAAERYPGEARVAGTPLLAAPSWLPSAPVPLGAIRLEFRPDAPAPSPSPSPDISDISVVAPGLLPEGAGGTRYRRHSDVIRTLAPPAIFEDRTIYRLTAANLAGEPPRLAFTGARYFDGVDVGGAVAHELAAAQLTGTQAGTETGPQAGQPLRDAIGDPCDLRARPATMAVSALTLRHDRGENTASFPVHYRDPARVSHAGGMYQVIPVGIFQPSGEAPWNVANDFDLWRGLLREFAEELLGAGEDYGSESAPVDYAGWPLARRMTRALDDGRIRAYCLGLGTDPLTFATDLLTVVVIDAPLYDELFGGVAPENAEGTVLPPRPFDQPTITELITRHPVQAAGAALLKLAIGSRRELLTALPASVSRAHATRADAAAMRFKHTVRLSPGGLARDLYRTSIGPL